MTSLTQWTESHFNAIYTPAYPWETIKAIDNFLSKDVVITVNGHASSRIGVLINLGLEKGLESAFELTFVNTVEVPTDKSKPAEAGAVGAFYTAIIQVKEGLTIFGAPQKIKVTGSLNIDVEQDPSVSGSDKRRVRRLNLVFTFLPVAQ